jgi:hypothetical protein
MQCGGEYNTQDKQEVDPKRLANCRRTTEACELNRRQQRRARLDQRFAKKKRQPHAHQHQGNTDGDVVDSRLAAEPSVKQSGGNAAETGTQHPQPRTARKISYTVSDDRPKNQRPFKTQVYPAALFSDCLT